MDFHGWCKEQELIYNILPVGLPVGLVLVQVVLVDDQHVQPLIVDQEEQLDEAPAVPTTQLPHEHCLGGAVEAL